MKRTQLILGVGVMASMAAASAVSFAQSVGNGTTPGALPASRSDNDPAPPVAAPLTAAARRTVARASSSSAGHLSKRVVDVAARAATTRRRSQLLCS